MAKVLVCLTVLLIASAISVAQTGPPSETSASLNLAASGKDFLRTCDDSNILAVVRGTCLGYVWGVIDSIHLPYGVSATGANSAQSTTKTSTKTGESFCIQDNVTADQKLRTVIQFIKAHPEEANSPTDALIWEAASEAFPCSPAAAKSGLDITRGGGEFGAKYPWYVKVIQKKVSDNWLKPELDPTLTAQRVYITFDIARDGHPLNVRVEQSSGVLLLDISAVRALQRINTFGPLPPDYVGNKISVEFWFDYKK